MQIILVVATMQQVLRDSSNECGVRWAQSLLQVSVRKMQELLPSIIQFSFPVFVFQWRHVCHVVCICEHVKIWLTCYSIQPTKGRSSWIRKFGFRTMSRLVELKFPPWCDFGKQDLRTRVIRWETVPSSRFPSSTQAIQKIFEKMKAQTLNKLSERHRHRCELFVSLKNVGIKSILEVSYI